MGWIQRLYETYENCADTLEPLGLNLWPVSHMVKQAHIEIVIDGKGCFRRARVLNKDESSTLIPVTEGSAGRTSGACPHPYSDEISYCAGDYPKLDPGRFDQYKKQLHDWCQSGFTHPKVKAVLKYIENKSIWSDLNQQAIFPVKIEGMSTKVSDEKAFIRWVIESDNDLEPESWKDRSFIDAWITFDKHSNNNTGYCMASDMYTRLTNNHPRFIRFPGDGGKLISSNDFSNFTFKGKFTDTKAEAKKDDYQNQACSIGFDVSQKAHNALRWLINRQGYKNGDQVIVAWSVGLKDIPQLHLNTLELLGEDAIPQTNPNSIDIGDAGQTFALQFTQQHTG